MVEKMNGASTPEEISNVKDIFKLKRSAILQLGNNQKVTLQNQNRTIDRTIRLPEEVMNRIFAGRFVVYVKALYSPSTNHLAIETQVQDQGW